LSRPLVRLLAAIGVAAAIGASAVHAQQKPGAQQRQQPAPPPQAQQEPQRHGQAGSAGDAEQQLQPGEKLPPAVAAVIDYQRVLREAKSAKSISDQLEARRKLYQDQIAKEEQKLGDADKELAKQRGVLSPEALSTKREDLQKRAAELQKLVNDKRRQLGTVSSAALNEVRNAMLQVVGDLSSEHGFNIVLPSNTVLMFSPKVDLTDEVIKRLDQALPSVKVPDKVAQDEPQAQQAGAKQQP
jgi:Skp family chaperone for outer membrane proteins